jgi:hypothetical protein
MQYTKVVTYFNLKSSKEWFGLGNNADEENYGER